MVRAELRYSRCATGARRSAVAIVTTRQMWASYSGG
jgi:hypothetical protein